MLLDRYRQVVDVTVPVVVFLVVVIGLKIKLMVPIPRDRVKLDTRARFVILQTALEYLGEIFGGKFSIFSAIE